MTGADSRPGVAAQVILRPAELADLAAIMVLEADSFGAGAWPVSAVREELTGEHGYYLVAESEGRLAGYAGLRVVASDGDIQTIAVAERFRGCGIGRRLMQALLAEAAERSAAAVFLDVRADNPVARALYESLGFEEIGLRPRYYQPEGVDAVVMKLNLRTGLLPGVGAAVSADRGEGS